ncbi:MAG: hypothetical protein AOA66_0179 [Candidatus Bathyarchaeota archaeon BA2]|nr:MAG: hypothetical protein AOA66_0179 [Candidatus Bathyarchaeota archaeon BA2]
MSNNYGKECAYKIFSAVFSKKPSVSTKRVAILQALSKFTEGKTKFRDILREVQSEAKDIDYSSQKLSYDLRMLRQNGLINQTWDGEYTITANGYSLLTMYREIAHRVSGPQKQGRTGFVGEVNGRIKADRFDPHLLGEELAKLALFRRKFLGTKERFCLELKDDDDNLRSEIEIRKSGHFSVKVILYPDNQNYEKGFLDDFEQGEEWYEAARGMTQAVLYYIKRVVRKHWRGSEVETPPPDSYPI